MSQRPATVAGQAIPRVLTWPRWTCSLAHGMVTQGPASVRMRFLWCPPGSTRFADLHVCKSDLNGLQTVRYHGFYGVPGSLTAAITHEDPWYVARCLDVEVASQGETAEEALANLKEALELYFEDEVLPDGLEPPIIATLRLTA